MFGANHKGLRRKKKASKKGKEQVFEIFFLNSRKELEQFFSFFHLLTMKLFKK